MWLTTWADRWASTTYRSVNDTRRPTSASVILTSVALPSRQDTRCPVWAAYHDNRTARSALVLCPADGKGSGLTHTKQSVRLSRRVIRTPSWDPISDANCESRTRVEQSRSISIKERDTFGNLAEAGAGSGQNPNIREAVTSKNAILLFPSHKEAMELFGDPVPKVTVGIVFPGGILMSHERLGMEEFVR
jgi:hypothetical protein